LEKIQCQERHLGFAVGGTEGVLCGVKEGGSVAGRSFAGWVEKGKGGGGFFCETRRRKWKKKLANTKRRR